MVATNRRHQASEGDIMATPHPARSVLPHPPSALPRYFAASPFDGAQIAAAGAEKSERLELYERLAAEHFATIPEETSIEALAWIERHHRTRLEIEREERRMHFGALALVSVLFFLLLPSLIQSEFASLPLTLLELLLLVLVVPYVLVYFGYENRVRAMSLGLLRVAEAIAVREQKAGRQDPAA
jgi:hypothetical protein